MNAMIKKTIEIILISIFSVGLVSCADVEQADPYDGWLHDFEVVLDYPQGHSSNLRAGVEVKVENSATLAVYKGETDAQGKASLKVPSGVYRVSVSDILPSAIFNGSSDKIVVSEEGFALRLALNYSKPGSLVIKEIYCGGCKKLPENGDYQSDKYIIIHNNNMFVEYLDSLCFGSISPYNSQAVNPWITKDPETGTVKYPDFAPIAQAIWQFRGTGKDYPVQPGEDVVICLNGAIDHTKQYPLSVNLNKPEYFVTYNSKFFYNSAYHPVPGNNIPLDHYLEVVIKLDKSNAYTMSISSPAVVLFKAKGTTMVDFVKDESQVQPIPGSNQNVITLPWDWILDGVEVFTGKSLTNTKRLTSSIDAGYVTLSDTFMGKTLHRHVDEAATAERGYEVLMDTNNSSKDFYERPKQSLHE